MCYPLRDAALNWSVATWLGSTPTSLSTMEYPRITPHIVEVNLQGLTGIVVERFLCRDVNHAPSSPSPPYEMKAVVAVGHPSGGATFGVSALSSPLKRSPVKEGIAGRVSGKQRFLALWKKENVEALPPIVFETDLPVRPSDLALGNRSKVNSKEYELRILLTDGTATIPIATATLEVRTGLESEGQKLVLHPSWSTESGNSGTKCIYSVDPTSSRLQADIVVREKSELLRGAWGSQAPPYEIKRFVSKAEDAIEVVDEESPMRTQDVLCLESESALTVVSLSHSVSTNAASIASLHRSLLEEKKEEFAEASDDSCCADEESVEIHEDATFKATNYHHVRSNATYKVRSQVPSLTSTLDSDSEKPNHGHSPSRPPKPPSSRRVVQRNPPPPPPPPPPPLPPPPPPPLPPLLPPANALFEAPNTPSVKVSPASDAKKGSSRRDRAETHDNDANVPPSKPATVGADPATYLTVVGDSSKGLAKIEAESKVSTVSGTSGSSAGFLSFKPHLISRLHERHASKSKGKPTSSREQNKLRLKPRVLDCSTDEPVTGTAMQEQRSNAERRSGNQIPADFPPEPVGPSTTSSQGNEEMPSSMQQETTHRHQALENSVPIWTEKWDEDYSTKQSDEETCTFYTKHTATTLQSRWGNAEKFLSMIPWSRIDTLLDSIPIGSLPLLRFASPAEFEDETYDNASLCPNSTLDTMTDEGSLTVYRRSEGYVEDDISDRLASFGCWVPQADAFGPSRRGGSTREGSSLPKFDLPDYDTVDEMSTVDYASITSASFKVAGSVGGSVRRPHPKPAAYELESLEAMSDSEDIAHLAGNRCTMFAFKQAEPFTREPRQDLSEHPATFACTPDRRDFPPRRPNEELIGWNSPKIPSLRRSAPSGTESSPVAVNEFPATPPRFGEAKRHIVSITDFFRRDRIDEESLIDSPSQPEIFVVDDGQSLGDLTLTTHEMLLELNHSVNQNFPQMGEEPSSHANTNQRQGRFGSGTGFLSIFSCTAPDGLCAPTSTVAATDTVSLGAKSVPPKSQESSRKSQDARDRDSFATREDLNIVALDESVHPEMRAAAEAAWLKRMAELERIRPSNRKGFEV